MVATTRESTVTLQLLVSADVTAEANGTFRFSTTTDLPSGQTVNVAVHEAPETAVTLRVPSPGWASSVTITVNGNEVEAEPQDGYLAVTPTWQAGDSVSVAYGHQPTLITRGPSLASAHNRTALIDGPLVYWRTPTTPARCCGRGSPRV